MNKILRVAFSCQFLIATIPIKIPEKSFISLPDDPRVSILVLENLTPLKLELNPIRPIPYQDPPEIRYSMAGASILSSQEDIRTYARQIITTIFGKGQFEAFNEIVESESGWNPYAREKESGAYGIGQALPPEKMRVFGDDYLTNPITQINWMVSYIKDRYHNPIRAWQFHLKNHWY